MTTITAQPVNDVSVRVGLATTGPSHVLRMRLTSVSQVKPPPMSRKRAVPVSWMEPPPVSWPGERARERGSARPPLTSTLAMAVLVWTASAQAQNAPLPPLQQQWEQQGTPPVQQAPPAPNGTGPGNTDQAAPGLIPPSANLQGQAPAPPSAPPPASAADWPNVWIPATAAKLQALDKVDAQASDLTIKVGQSAKFGSLTITVKSCMVRPTGQPSDAAAYLNVTDSHPDTASFDGWLLRDEPSVSMMQSAIYDLRVTGCS
jgi:hypothetical protein